METRRKRCLKSAAGERLPNILLREELEWPDLSHQELELDMESTRFIYTEEDPYHTEAENHAVQRLTPVSQTEECIKTESEIEFLDDINVSEATCKYDAVPLADNQQVKASISDNKIETGHRYARPDSAEGLRRERVAHPERKWKCKFCPLSFKTKPIFKNHLKTHDEDRKREIACDSCDRTFYTRKHLWSHKRVHVPGKYRCEECGKHFTRKEGLDGHMRTLHLDKAQQEETFECGVCPRSFKTKPNLKRHLNTHDKDRGPEFFCNTCTQTLYTQNSLSRHRKVHARESYHCKVCGRRFTQEESLKVHMLGHQDFNEMQEITPQLSNDAVVPMETELISDEEFIDEGNGKDAGVQAKSGEQVPNVLLKQEDLANHEAKLEMESLPSITTGEDPYHTNAEAETYAVQGFTPVPQTDEYLKTELVLDEDIIGELNDSEPTGKYDGLPLADGQQVSTDISVKESATRELSSLIDAAKPRVGDPERKWKCELCPRSFKTRRALKSHLATHDKDRKREYACDSCDRTFYTRRHLWSHKRVHVPGKYRCEECGKHFTRKQGLDGHMRTLHAECGVCHNLRPGR